jgi:hypothetical protein
MSKVGAVIIANDTEKFSYYELARIASERVTRHLGIPCSIINSDYYYNSRFLSKTQEKIEWRNMGRTGAYDLSPYDRTLLIDADFLINTDALLPHINCSNDFAIARTIFDPTTGYKYVMKVGKSQIDQCWATVMIFNRSETAKNIFKLAQHVLNHYDYYHKLYNFNASPLRNDYAFSIACHLLGGYGLKKFDIANYSMPNCDFNTEVLEINKDDVLIKYTKEKTFVQRIKSDVHIQDKISLFEAI